MTLSDRRMKSLLNKSPESGYIHSRSGASDSQHLCTMKINTFLKKSITEDTNKRGKGEEPLSKGCSAPGMALAARKLI
jgi:hypothetical protein